MYSLFLIVFIFVACVYLFDYIVNCKFLSKSKFIMKLLISGKYYKCWRMWNDYVHYPPQYLWYGIKNCWYWFPIIWNDRDWDQAYLTYVVKHKLISMKKFWESGLHMSMKDREIENVKSLSLCIKLINRLNDDDYTMKEWDVHWIKYGKPEWEPVKNEEGKVYSNQMITGRHLTFQQKEEEREDVRRLAKKSDVMRERDKVRIGKIMQRYMDQWWD